MSRIKPEKMTQLLMDKSALSVRPATEISLVTRSAHKAASPVLANWPSTITMPIIRIREALSATNGF
ncbi:MAG: hypothetical protein WA274_24620 [Candidatus Acidiferrales bacterium]